MVLSLTTLPAGPLLMPSVMELARGCGGSQQRTSLANRRKAIATKADSPRKALRDTAGLLSEADASGPLRARSLARCSAKELLCSHASAIALCADTCGKSRERGTDETLQRIEDRADTFAREHSDAVWTEHDYQL